MESSILYIRLIISIVNLSILTYLIYAFAKKYREIKSEFTLGFLLFALALWFRTFFAAPIVKIFIFGISTASIVDPYRLIADVFELFALGVFLYISTR